MQLRNLKESSKIIIMAALFSGACFLAYYYHAILHTDILFTHLFYIPIVLVSIWWKRRGIPVAALLGLLLLVSHVLFTPDISLIPDLCRAAMFIVIASAVAFLSEQTAAAVLLYKTLAGGSHTGVYILQNGKLQYVNQRALEYVGYSEEEMMKMPPLDWIHPDDKEEAHKHAVEMLKGVRKMPYEFRVISRDGRIKWILETVAPIQFKGRKAVLGNAMDITERKRAEESLKIASQRFSEVLNSLDALVYVTDMKTHELLFINKYGRDIWGDVEGKICWQTIQEGQDGPCEFCTNDKLVDADGKPTGVLVWEFQNTVNKRWYECRDRAIYWPDGRVVRMEIASDITERKHSEALILESEEKYRTILENIEDGYHEVDLAGSFTFFNDSFLKIMDYSGEELMGMNYKAYAADEENARRVFEAYNSVYRTGRPIQRFEWDVVRKDGARRSVEVSASLIRDSSGKPLGFRGIVRDTTERKEKTAEIEMKSVLLDSASDSIFVMDLEGNFHYVNESAYKSRGYSRDELVAMNLKELDDPAYREAIPFRFREVMEKGKAIFESAHRRKDGSVMPVEVHSRLMNMEGRTFLFSVIRDITERKQAEEALRESEEKFNELAHSLPQIVFEMDTSGKLTFVNLTAYSMSGYSPDDFGKGLNGLQLIAPEDRERARMNMQRIMQGEDLRSNEYTFLRKDGRTFPVIAETVPIIRNNQTLGLRGIMIDLTERKQLEARLAEARRMEAIGRLSSGASHEIRNPLNIMSMRLQMMELTGKTQDKDVLHVIKTCHEQIGRITRILEGLDDFSRIPEVRKASENINEIVEEVLSVQDERLRGAGVAVRIDRAEGIPLLMLDKDKIALVISHLVSNAVDAMKDRETKKLDLSIGKTSSGESVQIVVSDTGHGIKEADLTRIFDPFFTTKAPDKGKGLGLAVSYGVIRDHGGTIWAENNKEGGASFFVDLPIEGSEKIS